MIKKNKSFYETAELKLAALILSEIPESTFTVSAKDTLLRKTIIIDFPAVHEQDVALLREDFLNKRALVNLYLYNRSLNQLRDVLMKDGRRENENGCNIKK